MVRRRLNSVLIQHWLYLCASAVVLVMAALIAVGLRGSSATFRVALWGAVIASVGAAAGCALALWRRWLDIQATAHLADRRAQLTDRLATLVDLRRRPRATRLAPVLIAQLLALGPQWSPSQIVPRRVPRTILLLVASILALGSTAFLVRPELPPQPQASAANSPRAEVEPPAPPTPAPWVIRQAQPSSDRALEPSEELADSQGTMPAAARSAVGKTGSGDKQGLDLTLASLPDKLQGAIRRALDAQAVDKPRALTAGNDESQGDTGGGGDRATSDTPRERNAGGSAKTDTGKGSKPGEAQQAAGTKSDTNPRPEGHAQEKAGPQQPRNGSASTAGSGSSPEGLMDPNAPGLATGTDAPKTFKLTITSFLRTMEQKGTPPRQGGKRAGASSDASTVRQETTALSDRQLNDDVMRKAEIPPEYEEIVRRVYSARSEP